jgi:hypothetical protein
VVTRYKLEKVEKTDKFYKAAILEINEEINSIFSNEGNNNNIEKKNEKSFSTSILENNRELFDLEIDEICDELSLYLNEKKFGLDKNPLEYWKTSSFEKLSVLAKYYLGISSSAAFSERVWSRCRNIVLKLLNF